MVNENYTKFNIITNDTRLGLRMCPIHRILVMLTESKQKFQGAVHAN